MPIRVIQSGLPGIQFDDSSASPFIPAVAQASNTLLELGPKLAQIKMQQQANEREFGLRQQELGMEGRRVDMQGRVTDANILHTRAQMRHEAQDNAKNILGMGASPDQVMQSDDWQQGFGAPNGSVINPAPIAAQMGQDRALRVEGEQATNHLKGAEANFYDQRPAIMQAQVDQRDKAAEAKNATAIAAQDQAIHKASADKVDVDLGSMTSPNSQQYRTLLQQDPTGTAATKFKNKLVDQEHALRDPSYMQRKQAAFLQQLNAMGPQ